MPKKHKLRDVFNRFLWNRRLNPEDYTVTFTHRGAAGDRRTVSCSRVVKVGGSWFLYQEGATEVFIPFHRVLEVKNTKTKEALWEKTRRKQTSPKA